MQLIRPRWTVVKEFLWRVLYVLLAALFVLTAGGAFVNYWVHTIHTLYTEGLVIFWASLVVWMGAMLVISTKGMGRSRMFGGVLWTGLVWIVVIGILAHQKHCDGSLAQYLHLGQLEHCTGP